MPHRIDKLLAENIGNKLTPSLTLGLTLHIRQVVAELTEAAKQPQQEPEATDNGEANN